ncbi:MAG: trehalase family glycosidase, partial [Candidatus Eremiobacterota bacterium]
AARDRVTLNGWPEFLPDPRNLPVPAPSLPLHPPAALPPLPDRFPPGPEGDAWRRSLTLAGRDRLAVPFAYPGRNGLLEQNDLQPVVRGLRALGLPETARGVLENWLELGERYTCLPGSNQLNELGRSGLPGLSSLVLEEADTHPDPEFLERAYRVVADDYRTSWCDPYFKQGPNGLNRFCDVDYSPEESLRESGGSKNAARFEGGNPLGYQPVDLNARLYRTEKDLAEMARRLGKGQEAEKWEERASRRKTRLLGWMWDESSGSFRDLRAGEKSPVETLACLEILSSGVLDRERPEEMTMAVRLASVAERLIPEGGGLPTWDDRSGEPAEPADVLATIQGLRAYGLPADRLEEALRRELSRRPVSDDVAELGVRALIEPAAGPAEEVPEMSPEGGRRLAAVVPGAVPGASDTGKLDRHLRSLSASLFQPEVISELKARGLADRVYGLTRQPLAGVGLPVKPPLSLGGVPVEVDMPGVLARPVGTDAVELVRGQDRLLMAALPGGLLVGDRFYSAGELPPDRLRLPQDLLGVFFRAGDNPALERFFDRHREWLAHPDPSPATRVEPLAPRPGWVYLFEQVARNWRTLTVEPSVVAGGSAMQIFHPAAVPSLGIFKTQFNWDTLFMAKGMVLQGEASTVAGMADNLLYLLKSTGRVPNAARSVYLNKSQPPILPRLVKMSAPVLAARDPREAARWTAEAYQAMKEDYRDFWCRAGERGVDTLEGRSVRLSRWGGPNHKFAMDESGFDTTSRFDGRTLDLIPPDLNAFLYRYALDMADLADEVGRPEEAREWRNDAADRKRSVLDRCWDEHDGLFRDYRFQGGETGLVRDNDSLSAAVAPLWAGMLDPAVPRERAMIERSLRSLSRFEKPFGLASTADDGGHPEMQWNGPSGWAPLHMMAIEAAARYGDYASASRWIGKWLDLVDGMSRQHGVILERYDVVRGGFPPVQAGRYEETQGDGPGFGWTNASIPWGLVEVIAGTRFDGSLRVEPHFPDSLLGHPLKLTYRDPAGRGSWRVEQRYDGETYRLEVEGDPTRIEVLTPPLPSGRPPEVEGALVYEIPFAEGRSRYRIVSEGTGRLTAH